MSLDKLTEKIIKETRTTVPPSEVKRIIRAALQEKLEIQRRVLKRTG
jgi:hypothetical protein